MLSRTLAVSLLAVALLSACGDDDNGPDTRCFNAAQVPAWDVAFTVQFSDTGTAQDTFRVRLNHQVDGNGTTGPAFATSGFEGRAWFTIKATGSMVVHDTVINVNLADTLAAVASAFSGHPGDQGDFSGGYVSVNLETCKADVGALFFGPATITTDGVAGGIDTLRIGYSLVQDLTVDSLAVANGWTIPAAKVATRAGAFDFAHERQYLALSVSGRYAPGANVDSATISFVATPADAPLTVRGW